MPWYSFILHYSELGKLECRDMSINLCKQYVHFDAVHTTQTHGEKGQEKKRQVGNMGLTYTHSLLYWAAYKENY